MLSDVERNYQDKASALINAWTCKGYLAAQDLCLSLDDRQSEPAPLGVAYYVVRYRERSQDPRLVPWLYARPRVCDFQLGSAVTFQ